MIDLALYVRTLRGITYTVIYIHESKAGTNGEFSQKFPGNHARALSKECRFRTLFPET
jgi:hypothetical protein